MNDRRQHYQSWQLFETSVLSCSKIRRSSERISLRFVILFFCYRSSFYFGSTQQDNYKCSQTVFQRKLNIFVQPGQTKGMVRIPHSETLTTHLQVPESKCKQEIFTPGTLTINLRSSPSVNVNGGYYPLRFLECCPLPLK